jgi:3,4-dihydroxy-9,10-secoandrosta-1,3,5(10)-triene-9,17-dione 4,5-dioxygenase
MSVRELGYLGLETTDLGGWIRFGREVLGLATARHSADDVCHLKADDRPHRLTLRAGAKDRLAYAGWGVRDAEAFEEVRHQLASAGFEPVPATDAELSDRRVQAMFWCTDPGGFRVELFHSPILDHQRFISPVGVERFVAGDLGLGHIVLLTDHYEESFDFYVRLLGFRLSDSMVLDKRPLRFLRCNPRHHSLALAPHHSSRLAHMMLEVPTIDEVGYCMDRCRQNDVPIAMTLGRHTNDMMVSFYMRAPRAYEIEYGCGGLCIDEEKWSTQEITAVSFWGHHRELK